MAELTRDEKIAQFNDLRKKYCSLFKSLKFYEKEIARGIECDKVNKEEAIEFGEKGNLYEDPEDLVTIVKEEKRKEWEPYPHFAPGWSVRKSNFGDNFSSPEGKYFHNFLAAIRHLKKHEILTPEECLKRIEENGWKTKTTLPKNWFFRQTRGNRSSSIAVSEDYLSDSWTILSSIEHALQYLKSNNYGKNFIDMFLKDNGRGWKIDPNLPMGWRYAEHYSERNQTFIKNFMNPEGRRFSGIAHVLRWFIDNGDGVEPLLTYLRNDGWLETDLLPPNHFMKPKNTERGFSFLTPNGKRITTIVKVESYLRNEYKWQEALIKKFLNNHKSLYTNDIVKKRDSRSKNYSELDNSLVNSFYQRKENYPENDLEKKRKGFVSDGWKPTVYLPDGWMNKESAGVMTFLTPEFQIIKDDENVELFFDKYKLHSSLITLFKWEKSEENVDDLIKAEDQEDPTVNQSFKKTGLPKDWGAEITETGDIKMVNNSILGLRLFNL